MRFLSPQGGDTDKAFGTLSSPSHKGIPKMISNGRQWAADNNAFTKNFNPALFFSWLERMKPYKSACIFVTVPDQVGNAIQTLSNFRHWIRYFEGWPVAFVAQDGQENLPFPNYFDTLFIGGTTRWKESQAAIDCIKRAQALGKHIHIGRVNWKRRYNLFNILTGSQYFTCDGTRPQYDGKEATTKAWLSYMAQRPLITI